MKFRASVLCMWLIGCVAAHAEPPGSKPKPRPNKDVTISVVATNDLHGRLGQLPLFGGYVNNVRAAREADGGGVLVLDAGDIFQGTLASNLTEGASMLRAFRALGYDAAALGNHEFDFGPTGPACTPVGAFDDPLGALRARIAESSVPILSANLRTRDGAPVTTVLPGLKPSVLREVAGVRVGIVGGLTEEALTATHGANVAALSVAPLAESIAFEAQALRAEGAQIVVAIVHAGGECKQTNDPDDLSSCDERSELFEMVRAFGTPAPVDLVIGGHTHAFVAHRVAGIPIIESHCNGRAFGRADLVLAGGDPRALEVRIHPPTELCQDVLAQPVCATKPYEGRKVERDARVLESVTPDLEYARKAAETSLGVEIVSPIERSSAVESPLSNLIVDLMRRAIPGAQAAFNNPGSVRISLMPGPLTYGRMFEMFPFENRLASLRMRVKDLARVVQNSLQSDRGLVSLSGVRAAARCHDGELKVTLTTPAGGALPPGRVLRVVTSDYVAASGDELLHGVKLPAANVVIHPERTMRDALISGLQSYGGGRIDGRDPKLFDGKRPRLQYPAPRPVRCEVARLGAQGPT